MFHGSQSLIKNAQNIRNCIIEVKDFIENDDRYSIVNDTIKHDYFDTITIKCNERDTFNNIINEANKRQIFLRTSPKNCFISVSFDETKGLRRRLLTYK